MACLTPGPSRSHSWLLQAVNIDISPLIVGGQLPMEITFFLNQHNFLVTKGMVLFFNYIYVRN